ncbi:MAG: hydantoinase/oxoprolinase N-terminal domain-containing protein [Clostridia bacterium]
MERTWRVGIDVGGTNTDAVLLDEAGNLWAQVKTPTTGDVAGGITAALAALLADPGLRDRVGFVMLGTTHCTNAIVERRGLCPVAALRLGAPASTAVPPFTDWPADLAAALDPRVAILPGGFEFDGREIAALDEEAVRRFARTLDAGRAVAVVSIFAPVADAHERRAEEIIREVAGPDVSISRSAAIGSIGLLERENATILNAALGSVMARATDGFEAAVRTLGLDARCFLTQNDGTLMTLEDARRFPIFTIASGPTNSLRGAAYLTGLDDALVIDVGGTTTDVGALVSGFPRESSVAVEIGGVRTNFRMPDLLSLGLGGGSRLRVLGDRVVLGPDSVGFRLPEKARVFGGDEWTASDAAVAGGRAKFGDASRLADWDAAVPARALAEAGRMVQGAVERMRLSADLLSVIAVGGGAFLVPDGMTDVIQVLRPQGHDVANAIGAAIAEVSGDVDRVYSLDSVSREAALRHAEDDAIRRAVAGGADAEQVRIVDREDLPLAYLPGSATRIRVKAVGPLRGLARRERPRAHA